MRLSLRSNAAQQVNSNEHHMASALKNTYNTLKERPEPYLHIRISETQGYKLPSNYTLRKIQNTAVIY